MISVYAGTAHIDTHTHLHTLQRAHRYKITNLRIAAWSGVSREGRPECWPTGQRWRRQPRRWAWPAAPALLCLPPAARPACASVPYWGATGQWYTCGTHKHIRTHTHTTTVRCTRSQQATCVQTRAPYLPMKSSFLPASLSHTVMSTKPPCSS